MAKLRSESRAFLGLSKEGPQEAGSRSLALPRHLAVDLTQHVGASASLSAKWEGSPPGSHRASLSLEKEGGRRWRLACGCEPWDPGPRQESLSRT